MSELHQPEIIDQIPSIDLQEFNQAVFLDSTCTESWRLPLPRKRKVAIFAGILTAASSVAGFAHAQARNDKTTIDSKANSAQNIPTVFNVIEPYWQQDIKQIPHPGWELLEPKTEDELRNNINFAAPYSYKDPITEVQITRVKASTKFRVKVIQENKRVEVTTAQFIDPNNTGSSESLGESIDADLYADKTVRVRAVQIPSGSKPALSSEKMQGTPSGKSSTVTNWSDFSVSNLAHKMENGRNTDDPLHTARVEVTPNKHLTVRQLQKLIRAGKFFIDVTQTWKFRDQAYQDAAKGQIDGSDFGKTYKVLPGSKTTIYVTGNHYKSGDILTH